MSELEGNFAQIPNKVLDALAESRIPREARQVLDVVLRLTFGWSREWDAISLSEFQERTGLSRKAVCRGINTLRRGKVIRVKKHTGSRRKRASGRRPVAQATLLITQYALNKEVTEWKSIKGGGVTGDTTPVSQETPIKESKIKKNDKKRDKDPSHVSQKEADVRGKDDVYDEFLIGEMRKDPGKKWNSLILLYFDRFGFLPVWSRNQGIKKEFVALSRTLKILDGDMERLLRCFEQYLADGDPFLVKNGHRPSLINNLLDGFLRRLDDEQSSRKYEVPAAFRI